VNIYTEEKFSHESVTLVFIMFMSAERTGRNCWQ